MAEKEEKKDDTETRRSRKQVFFEDEWMHVSNKRSCHISYIKYEKGEEHGEGPKKKQLSCADYTNII